VKVEAKATQGRDQPQLEQRLRVFPTLLSWCFSHSLKPISKGIFQNMRIEEVFGLAALFAAVAGEICKK
jgi:hypothetical protein